MKASYQIYSGGKPYDVSEEVYQAINQLNNRIYYCRHHADQCHANLRLRANCEGDCPTCRWYANQEDDIDDAWIISNRVSHYSQDSSADEAACDAILRAMQAVDPDGRRIGMLYLQRCTDREIARILGITRSAYARRKAKIRRHLRAYLADADT